MTAPAPRKGEPFALTLPLATEVIGRAVRVVNADGDDVAFIGEVGPETRRIADLFAASPEMLDALRAAERLIGGALAQTLVNGNPPDEFIAAGAKVRNAIAKAGAR